MYHSTDTPWNLRSLLHRFRGRTGKGPNNVRRQERIQGDDRMQHLHQRITEGYGYHYKRIQTFRYIDLNDIACLQVNRGRPNRLILVQVNRGRPNHHTLNQQRDRPNQVLPRQKYRDLRQRTTDLSITRKLLIALDEVRSQETS